MSKHSDDLFFRGTHQVTRVFCREWDDVKWKKGEAITQRVDIAGEDEEQGQPLSPSSLGRTHGSSHYRRRNVCQEIPAKGTQPSAKYRLSHSVD